MPPRSFVMCPQFGIRAATALAVSVLIGCTPDDAVFDVQPQSSADGLETVRPAGVVLAARSGRTLRDEYATLAARVPGGFAGFYYDVDQRLTVVLVNPAEGSAALSALAAEGFVQRRAAVPGRAQFDVHTARVVPGTYPYDRLYQWYQAILPELTFVPTRSSISVVRNRILIGISAEDQRVRVSEAVSNAGVDPNAVDVELFPGLEPVQSLGSDTRPVPAGVQTRYNASGQPRCTVGPNLYRLGQRGFLVNSHCTKYPFQVNWGDVTHFWQASQKFFTPFYPEYNHIGNEAIDPPLFTCVENPNGCRNSDAALGLYASYASYELSYIARPDGRNTRSILIDVAQPRFQIVWVEDWSTDGEILEKVGRTTGWSGGQVLDACITVPMGAYSIRCAMLVQAEAGPGDSGAPLFKTSTGTQVELRGTVFAMVSGTFEGHHGACTGITDPIDGGTVFVCNLLVANNMGGILLDLDPWGVAPLQFW